MLRPISVVTGDVSKELSRIAKINSISASEFYIEINSVATFVKEGDSDFIELSKADLDQYKDEKILRDKSVEFRQEYDIDITRKDEGYPFKDMTSEIEFEENGSLAYFVIKKGSKLNYGSALYSDFLKCVTERKLRAGVMLYLFEVDCKDGVKQLVDVVEKIKSLTFKEDKKFLVSKGINKIDSIKAEVYMNVEANNEVGSEDDKGKVDYSNRGFLLSCVEGEQLFEFIKPQQGEHGRTCRGDLIEVETVNLDIKPTFTVEDGIEVRESFENIKYLSKKSGFLEQNGNEYVISNNVEVEEISFTTTGTIDSDLDSEITINVIKENPLEDAVEKGMRVKVQKLAITGSIGPNTEIEARDISISGQSHKDSSIKCVNANIGTHKGMAVGRRVEVHTLEGGEIIADVAIVHNAVRGKIRANTIEIATLGSRVTMEASQYIKVDRAKGEENKFIIDASAGSGFGDHEKDDDGAYLDKLKEEFKALLASFKESKSKVHKNLEQCEKIKVEIIKKKNQGEEISSMFIKNYKICNVMKVRYKKLKEELEYKKSQIDKQNKKMSKSDLNVFDSRVIVEQSLKGYNYILYRLTNPEREIKLNTDDSMKEKIFKLVEDEDGILKIVNAKESKTRQT